MLPPGDRNWQLIFPPSSVTKKKKFYNIDDWLSVGDVLSSDELKRRKENQK
jgi:hypothetical protein